MKASQSALKRQLVKAMGHRIHLGRLALSNREGEPVSQRELGRRIKSAAATVTRYEKGHAEPTLLIIQDLARALGVEACYLAFGCDHPTAAVRKR